MVELLNLPIMYCCFVIWSKWCYSVCTAACLYYSWCPPSPYIVWFESSGNIPMSVYKMPCSVNTDL
jgi:hypothetical protein